MRWRIWLSAIAVLVCLAVVSHALLAPIVSARHAVRLWSDEKAKDGKKQLIADLGGPAAASRSLGLYLRCPQFVAPNKSKACELLSACGEPGIEALVRATKGSDSTLRYEAMSALNTTPSGVEVDLAADAACDLATDPDVRMRRLAVELLGKMPARTSDIASALVGALSDGDSQVKISAARSLGKFGLHKAKAARALAALMRSGDRKTKIDCVHAILALGPDGKTALPELIRFLGEGPSEHGTWPFVSLAIGQMGVSALDELEKAYDTSRGEYRERILVCLGPMGNKGLPLLRKGLKDNDPLVRDAAVYAMGDMVEHADTVIPLLESKLNDESVVVRSGAEESLKRIRAARKWLKRHGPNSRASVTPE